jgi:hypothetical protein
MRRITILLISLVLISSCNKDEDNVETQVTTADFETAIEENPQPMEEIGVVTGSANTGDVTFEIESQEPQGAFSIDVDTGLLRIADVTAFDYETNPIISGVVKVSNSGVSENATVLINIIDVEDSIITVEDFSVQIDENPPTGQSLGTMVASTDQGTLSFSISSQIPEGAFAINTNTGELTVDNAALFDFEMNEMITGVVSVTNQNITANANVTISLNDLNEIIVTTTNFQSTIDENPVAGQILGVIDGTTNQGQLTFTLLSQTPEGAFIVDAQTGELSVDDYTLFDFEQNPILIGIVEVANQGVTANSNITVNLNDLDDCIESNQLVQQELIDYSNDNNLEIQQTMDLTTHEYTFTPISNTSLCSIAYQAFDETPYLIEVVDSIGTILFSQMISFSTTEQDEFVLTSPISLTANENYTIRRIQNDWTTIDEVIGFIIIGNSFPVNLNELTILSSDFYGTGGPIPNFGIPYITLGFE